jgi:hypothetical protein
MFLSLQKISLRRYGLRWLRLQRPQAACWKVILAV